MFETVSLDSRLLQDMSCCQNGSRRWAHMGTSKNPTYRIYRITLSKKWGFPWPWGSGHHPRTIHDLICIEGKPSAPMRDYWSCYWSHKMGGHFPFSDTPGLIYPRITCFYVPNIFKYHILSSPVWNPNFGDLLPLFHDSKPPFLTTTPGVKLHWRSQRPWSPVQMEPMPMEIGPGSAVWPGRFWTSEACGKLGRLLRWFSVILLWFSGFLRWFYGGVLWFAVIIWCDFEGKFMKLQWLRELLIGHPGLQSARMRVSYKVPLKPILAKEYLVAWCGFSFKDV
jgi:hypothetical protein